MNTLELSRHEKPGPQKNRSTSRKTATPVVYEFDPNNPPPLTSEQKAELQALAEKPAGEIDTTDIPELDWSQGVIIRNPWIKPPTKTRLKDFLVDSDIIYWVVKQAGNAGCRDKLNAMLRRAMDEERAEQDQDAAP